MGKNMNLKLIAKEFVRYAMELEVAMLLPFKLALAAKVKVRELY